jgi:hypothetical protein
MGFFKKDKSSQPFWRVPPLRNAEPGTLHQHGISCIAHSDGPGAMATGWVLWDLAGLDSHQAWDLLSDGYRSWQDSDSYSRSEAKSFLRDMLDRLQHDPAVPWPDLYAVPPEQVQPLATHYSARCWVASELEELLDDTERATAEPVLFDAIRRARVEFVPPRSMGWATAYARGHGHPDPWNQSDTGR